MLKGGADVKTVRDEDPLEPGMQWSDPQTLQYGTTYAVRAVDEAGNAADLSPAATIVLPAKSFNWLTWALLLAVIALVLFILLTRKVRFREGNRLRASDGKPPER